ncbi:hypothetical protein PpBr36_08787 [Pyricularia pennisetigena]|uniref:hypothetical protein n=1 Tax=Pyricularia pennisetigena TaxID=1578925 RepID=UPI00114F91FF|nr:hypothetical protein PpBr36_08787 [Pyricularia pennisetigena]TLS23832.1 hypothetical protein PpBr36_08787 [Pyricularia pennisetigena]
MGKKRKASRQTEPSGPREVDPSDARLMVNSYEDLADSEEEYFINRDKILLEEGPSSKRRKADKEEEMLESSDEEVLDYGDSEDDESDDELDARKKKKAAEDEDEEDDQGYWGSNKKEYYEADALETEADALAEEAEAKKLQQKKLARMSEADFMFDADEWLGEGKDEDAEGDQAVTEVLKDVEITSDMGDDEVYRTLQARYPEFDGLVDEFQQLQPRLAEYQKAAEGKPSKSLEVVQYWTLGCYIAALASYIAILTSPVRDGDGKDSAKTLDPATLRDHDVMATLVDCREAWVHVKALKASSKPTSQVEDVEMLSDSAEELEEPQSAKADKGHGASAVETHSMLRKKKALEKKKLANAKKLEESLADLDGLLEKPKKRSKKDKAAPSDMRDEAENSDFGDEEILDAGAAEQKAARKKTLRFYTSQITQKADRRAGKGRDAGGDMDIPYRERLRDRQARLNAEAERRGQKSSKHGEDLDSGDDYDDEEAGLAQEVRGDEDEYYDMVAHGARQKKADKAARQEALKAAGKGDRVVEKEEIGEDGKRQVTYQILKNKGLAPKRKKDSQNPRVKKRKKFEQSKKKLKSMRPVYSGGEGKGGYQGELSGIKTGLVKSVKL